MNTIRVGWGVDAHRFGGEPPLRLGGVVADLDRGVEATSDGDLVVHAVIDALLGAAALGDLGTFFPSEDPRWHGANSFDLLDHALGETDRAGWGLTFVDVTVIAQSVRVGPIREAIRANLAKSLRLGLDAVSIKATTTDRMGWIGEDEGLAAVATATVARIERAEGSGRSDTGLLATLEQHRRRPPVDSAQWHESLNADASSNDPQRWAAALRDIHHVQHTEGISQALTQMMMSLRGRLVPLVARQLGVDEATALAAVERALSQSEPPLS